jgi:hypothetical protein
MIVARHKIIGLPGDAAFEELVVIGIGGDGGKGFSWLDDDSAMSEVAHESIERRVVAFVSLPNAHIGEGAPIFGQYRRGDEHMELSILPASHDLRRRAGVRDDAVYDQVRIDYYSQWRVA